MSCLKTQCVERVKAKLEEWVEGVGVPCLSGMVERLITVANAVMRQEQLIPMLLDMSGTSLKSLTGCREFNIELVRKIMHGLERFIESLVDCWGGKAITGELKYSKVPTMVVEVDIPWGHAWFNWALDYYNDTLRLEYYHFESRC